VICFVRATDDEAARQRLRRSLHDHQQWSDDFEGRFEALAGDLSRPELGLAAGSWCRLCHDVDAILHNGALVHWLTPYEGLKAVNVEGTKTLLRLASAQRLKAFHHVSTTAVFGTDSFRSLSVVSETAFDDDERDDCHGLVDGYAQSKWVAEQIVLKARRQGVPANVYRTNALRFVSR
jgi:L-aminoadipate-semialdehyde dehydrogenase